MEISGRGKVTIPGRVRPDNGQKWTQRAKKHLLVQYEGHLRATGQDVAPAKGLVVGGGEEVVAEAAGRCGVGVWRLVGGCVVALIG